MGPTLAQSSCLKLHPKPAPPLGQAWLKGLLAELPSLLHSPLNPIRSTLLLPMRCMQAVVCVTVLGSLQLQTVT